LSEEKKKEGDRLLGIKGPNTDLEKGLRSGRKTQLNFNAMQNLISFPQSAYIKFDEIHIYAEESQQLRKTKPLQLS